MRDMDINLPEDTYQRYLSLSKQAGIGIDELTNEAVKINNDRLMPAVDKAKDAWGTTKDDLFKRLFGNRKLANQKYSLGAESTQADTQADPSAASNDTCDY